MPPLKVPCFICICPGFQQFICLCTVSSMGILFGPTMFLSVSHFSKWWLFNVALLVMCCLLGGHLIHHSNISSEGASCLIAVPPSRASWQGGILCQKSVMSNIVTRSKEWDIQQLHRMMYIVKGYHYQFYNGVHHCSLLAAKITKP